ncbi:MAG: hypothetical protein WD688_22615 [Candidatus Binatia bacterium]
MASDSALLVKTGKFTAEHQRVLQDAFTDRSAGDYAGVFPAREEVERRFVEAVFIRFDEDRSVNDDLLGHNDYLGSSE